MGYKIREIDEERQFCEQVTVDVLQRVIGLEAMRESIALHGVCEERVRRLPALLTLLVCIGMNLLTTSSLTFVLFRLVHGTRLLRDVSLGACRRENKNTD